MPTFKIQTQAEWDALPQSFDEFTTVAICGGSRDEPIQVDSRRGSAHVVARDSAHVEAWDSAHVEAWDSAHVVARDSAHVEAWDSAHVEAWDSAHVVARDSAHVVAWDSAHVVAWDSAHVVARDSAHVVAWDSAHVVARDSAHVEARGSAHVVARGSAHVKARDSAHVEARDSAHVEAWDSAHVVARDSAHVEAWDSAHVVARDSAHVEARGSAHVVARGSAHVEARDSAHVEARDSAHVVLAGYSACHKQSDWARVEELCDAATVIVPKGPDSTLDWIAQQGLEVVDNAVTLYKRVSADFQTQEDHPDRTTSWAIGDTVEHANYNPTSGECGAGKFHACPKPYLCDEFRNKPDDRYIAIRVAVDDMHAWLENPTYPHKVGFRKGVVLYECDRYGERAGEVKAA